MIYFFPMERFVQVLSPGKNGKKFHASLRKSISFVTHEKSMLFCRNHTQGPCNLLGAIQISQGVFISLKCGPQVQ